ncbi:hypothetical protein P3T76_001832 [Phytophthora citrophthora]|uniref:Transposase putative helix-turn-helix domain-containing protein n=1 Tax=Phytophthora citrophthora TaxID=4793 RepID=A0AAD9GX87_9STRA|nr:hypothetical protein P3T76_001832 [Phytophthora citrophthora]
MNCLEPKPWFAFLKQRNTDQQTQSLLALEHFDNTARWPCDREKHESKRVTFESKPQRAAEISGYTATINVLKCNATDHADDIEAASAIRGELKAQDKLLTTRMRKYQLFPTTKQSQQLIRYMGTCRWTYNQAVAHFRATNVSKAATLRDLYVTQVSNKQRVYPEGMEPPPQWVYETPKSFRFNALRKFESSVKSAFSNPSTGNIKKFKVRFKSRKTDGRYFTFCEDASLATIQHRRGQRALLSISKLKGKALSSARRCTRFRHVGGTQDATSNSEAEMSFIAPIVITLRGEVSTLPSTFSGLSALDHYRRINNERNSLNTTGYSVEATEATYTNHSI